MALLTSAHAEARGTELALIDGTGSVSWAELDSRVNRIVNAMRTAGLQAGDTVALIAGNCRTWFEIALACAHGGWTYVPVNWHWVADELAYVFADAAPVAVFVDAPYADTVATALADERAASVRIVVRLDQLDDIIASADPSEPADQRLGGPMFYTSGTTGRPKGVRSVLSGNRELGPEILQLVGAGFGQMMPVGGRTLLCGPVYHSAQWAFSFLPMVGGSSVVMQHHYDSAEVLHLIDRHGVTNTHLVPTQMKRLIDLPESTRVSFDGSTLATVWHGAAPCPPVVKRALIDWWGPKINEYYGSTEGSIISTISATEWLTKGGSVGKPLDNVEVIVVGDDDRPVDAGVTGTLYFRNRMGMDFSYHNDDAKTAAVHRGPGVFTTGDVGHLDADGYLWLSDRRIDMIISGGVNIYPAEIEGALAAHAAVADVAVIGVPDDEYGENVKAIVQVADGHVAGEELAAALIRHCRSLLAGYKAPKSVDFIASIPRTGTGKIQKQPLRAPYWAGQNRTI